MTYTYEVAAAKQIVQNGGGLWLGLQEGIDCNLVLFQSPKTQTTLSLYYDDTFNSEAVQNKIRNSDKTFKPKTPVVSACEHLAANIEATIETFHEETDKEKK